MTSPMTTKFLNQEVINRYKDFGGVRIESDVVFLYLLLNLIKDNLVFTHHFYTIILSFLIQVTTYIFNPIFCEGAAKVSPTSFLGVC